MPKYLTRKSADIELFREHNEEWYRTESHTGHTGPAWKLDVGAECNRLLEHADKQMEFQLIETIRSIVERVANFEELEIEP